jgi:hypothetical protein
MRINVEFDSWEEMEIFRTSGKKTRGKSQMSEVEEAVELQASKADPTVTQHAEKQAQMAASTIVNPVPAQTFQPPAVATAPAGFPGANGPTPPAANPLVAAILARIDGAVATGQSSDDIVRWFRQQIGPDAANATIDQIRQVYVPRMSDAQLKSIAPLLGIQMQ